MGTTRKTISSSKHLVTLAGHDFTLPDQFEYLLRDREQTFTFQFRRFRGVIPPSKASNFRVGSCVLPVRLKREGIRESDSAQRSETLLERGREVYEVHGWIPIEFFITGYKRLIINSQGYRGSPRGEQDEFLRIGEMMLDNKCGSFVMYQHTGLWMLLDDPALTLEALSSDLRDVIDFCYANSIKICFTHRPELYLSGYSMGAGAAAVTAGEVPRVKRMLLIAPSPETREDLVVKSLERFEGELYLLHGKSDEIIPYRYSRMFSKAASRAKKVDLVQLIDCGHAFSGYKFQKAIQDTYRKAFEKRS